MAMWRKNETVKNWDDEQTMDDESMAGKDCQKNVKGNKRGREQECTPVVRTRSERWRVVLGEEYAQQSDLKMRCRGAVKCRNC